MERKGSGGHRLADSDDDVTGSERVEVYPDERAEERDRDRDRERDRERDHERRPVGQHVREGEAIAAPVQFNSRRDQTRWGPVWAGLIVALSTFLLLELLFFAFGWLTPGASGAGVGAPIVTALIGLFAFFLGGLIAGATAMWRGVGAGMLHGLLVWALGVVSFLLITVLGGGALFGSLGEVITQTSALQRANVPDIQAAQAVSAIRDTAGWAALGLGLSLAASVLGGLVGAKMWPRKKTDDDREQAPRVVALP